MDQVATAPCTDPIQVADCDWLEPEVRLSSYLDEDEKRAGVLPR
jgi:hypothetical protein